MNIIAVVVVVVLSVGFIIWVAIKNYKDRKKALPPGSTDDKPLESRMNKNRRRRPRT